MDNKIKDNIFIIFILIWILFSVALIANNNNLFDNIINIFIFINIILLLISFISFMQTKRNIEFEKKRKELINYIYKNNNDINNINRKINELLKINNSLIRKKLLIIIEKELIQMKDKELNIIMMNNLKKNINITKDQIRIQLIGQKEILENYKYECKSLILLLNLK
jgi:hypothetical protein